MLLAHARIPGLQQQQQLYSLLVAQRRQALAIRGGLGCDAGRQLQAGRRTQRSGCGRAREWECPVGRLGGAADAGRLLCCYSFRMWWCAAATAMNRGEESRKPGLALWRALGLRHPDRQREKCAGLSLTSLRTEGKKGAQCVLSACPTTAPIVAAGEAPPASAALQNLCRPQAHPSLVEDCVLPCSQALVILLQDHPPVALGQR